MSQLETTEPKPRALILRIDADSYEVHLMDWEMSSWMNHMSRYPDWPLKRKTNSIWIGQQSQYPYWGLAERMVQAGARLVFIDYELNPWRPMTRDEGLVIPIASEKEN